MALRVFRTNGIEREWQANKRYSGPVSPIEIEQLRIEHLFIARCLSAGLVIQFENLLVQQE